jgi:hypothetical protein
MKLPTIKLTRYRVVRDGYCGYEVQKWRLWWPFWMQCWGRGICNTHTSLEKAQAFIENHKKNNVVWSE